MTLEKFWFCLDFYLYLSTNFLFFFKSFDYVTLILICLLDSFMLLCWQFSVWMESTAKAITVVVALEEATLEAAATTVNTTNTQQDLILALLATNFGHIPMLLVTVLWIMASDLLTITLAHRRHCTVVEQDTDRLLHRLTTRIHLTLRRLLTVALPTVYHRLTNSNNRVVMDQASAATTRLMAAVLTNSSSSTANSPTATRATTKSFIV